MEAGRTDKAFDDLLRERYEGHSMVPDRSLWEDINTHLHHKRINRNTHRIKQLKIAISAVAAILTGVIAYSLIKTADDKPDTQHISEIPGTRPSSVNGNGKIQLLKQNNLRNQEKSGYTDKRTPGKTNPESIKGKTGTSEKNPATNNEYPDQVFDSSFNRPVQVTSSEYHNSISIMNRDIQPGVDNIQPDSISNDSLNINGTITSALPGSMRSEINPSADTIVTVADAIKPVSKLSYQDEMAIPEIDAGLDQPGVSAFSWKRRYPAHFFIEGFASPEFSYRALLTNTKFSFPDYNRAYFNKTERPDFTFSAGISCGFRLSDRLLLKSGAFYSRYSFKFKTKAFYISNTSTGGNLVYTSSGPVNLSLYSSDTLSNESLIRSSIDLSYINIPVTAELRFGYNFFLNLGINFNMLAWQNMNWQAEDYNGNFTETTADPINGLKFGGISIAVGLGKEKYIARQLSLTIIPSLRINLTSLNYTSPVKSYPYSWGLNAGLRYYFD